METTKVRLQYVASGPMRPDIIDLDNPSLAWVENEIDSGAADCACCDDAPEECDPESCPRFGSECSQCGTWVPSGEGAYLLDGGETFGECCIEWVDAN